MHILYLYQYFTTRQEVGHTRAYEFAKQFVRQGHRVTVVTSGAAADAAGEFERQQIDGIDVLRLKAGYSNYIAGNRLSNGQRIRAFLDFSRKAAAFCSRSEALQDVDVMYASSPPLTIALPAVLVSRVRRLPLVFEVRDCWPDAPIQMGALTNPFLIHAARAMERAAYGAARHIVALSPGMRDLILAGGIPPAKVSVVPNCADLDLFRPDLDGSAARRRLGLGDAFVCLYFGAMGEANGLDAVLDSAAVLRAAGHRDIRIVLQGDGKQREELERAAEERNLTNVTFAPAVPKRDIAEVVAAADVCLTHFKNVPVLYTCSPNKLFDSLAAGKPVIVNSPGWTKDLLETNHAGFYVSPNHPEDLANLLVRLRDEPELVRRYGANARRLAEREFDREAQALRLLEVLERARAGGGRMRTADATAY